jgi:hypothetical protein
MGFVQVAFEAVMERLDDCTLFKVKYLLKLLRMVRACAGFDCRPSRHQRNGGRSAVFGGRRRPCSAFDQAIVVVVMHKIGGRTLADLVRMADTLASTS